MLDPAVIRRVDSMYAFDGAVTAPLHGFASTVDYWTRASSKPWLEHIVVPTLILNARNDPFIPAHSLPGPAEVGPGVLLEQPEGRRACRVPRSAVSRQFGLATGAAATILQSAALATPAIGALGIGRDPMPSRQPGPYSHIPCNFQAKSSRLTTSAA